MVGDWAPLSFAVDALVGSFKDWIKPLTDVVDWLDKITASDFFSLLKNKGLALAADLGFDASQPLGPAIGSGPVNAAERMGAPAGMIAAGKATAGVTVISEGPTVDIQVTQQPGESGEELAKRIDERISQKEDERALAIQAALAPEPGG